MTLQATTTEPVSRQQIARYAGAVRDFNSIHVDEEQAAALGLPSVIAHGPLVATLALDALVAQQGIDAVKRMVVKFKAPVFPGTALSIVPTDDGLEIRTGDTAVASATVEFS